MHQICGMQRKINNFYAFTLRGKNANNSQKIRNVLNASCIFNRSGGLRK